jgi:GNAT superfamily N-acetyltransferase
VPAVTRTWCPEENEEHFELPGSDGQADGYANVIDRGREMWIAEIWVKPGRRGDGLGAVLLQAVLDRHAGRALALSAEPFDPSQPHQRPSLDDAQLTAWYERHGFRSDGGHRMVRPAAVGGQSRASRFGVKYRYRRRPGGTPGRRPRNRKAADRMDDFTQVQAAGCAVGLSTPDGTPQDSPEGPALILRPPAGKPVAVTGTPGQLAELAARVDTEIQAAFPEFARGLASVIDQAGELVENGLRLGERDADLFRIFAHAALMVASNPGVTLEEVLNDGFPGGADAVRRWWSGWT